MKKKLYLITLTTTLLLAGCGTSNKTTSTTPTVEPSATITQQPTATEESPAETTIPEETLSAASSTDAATETAASTTGFSVTPLPARYTDKASENMPDGTYNVTIYSDEIKQDGDTYKATLSFYDYDRYNVADIEKLKEGDYIQVQKQNVLVESKVENKDKDGNVVGITINGGVEEDGVDLLMTENEYRTTSLDDIPLYYEIGDATLPISKDVKIKDCIDYEKLPDGVDSTFKDLPDCISKVDPEYWTVASTEVTIQDGEIVNIIRNWRP